VHARPDLVGSLILASTNFGGNEVIPITAEALAVLTDRSGAPAELVRRGIEIAAAAGFAERQPDMAEALMEYRFTVPVPGPQYSAQVMAGAGMSLLTADQVNERMSAMKMPVLILFGEEDGVVPPGNARLMADKISGARTQIIPGTGHIFPIENPGATAAAVIEFSGSYS